MNDNNKKYLISIIIPVLNEEENFPILHKKLLSIIEKSFYDFEFIVIDNASTDRTPEVVKDICKQDSRWKYVRFSRNFTVEMSLTAGYRFAKGNAIVVLYSDLQDPPEVILQFLAKWEEGYDVVYGIRTQRPGDPAWRNFAVKIAYRLIKWFSDYPIPTDAGDFRLISRRVCNALNQCNEHTRYLRGLITWLGFKQIGILYERHPRESGVSKAPFWHTFFFAINAITSFSLKPLRIFLFFGFAMLCLSVVASIIYIYLRLVGHPPPGITTLIVLGLVAIGINSLGIGILGEYIGRTYTEMKDRPMYIIQESVNIHEVEENDNNINIK